MHAPRHLRRPASALALGGALFLPLLAGACGSGTATTSAAGGGTTTAAPATMAAHGEQPACEPVGDPATAATTVDVRLDDFLIDVSRREIPAGEVAFAADNQGRHAHELLVVRTSSLGALPKNSSGFIDEGQIPAEDFIGEVEGWAAGTSCTGVFSLTPGTYALVCAIVEDEAPGEFTDHFAKGMGTMITVT